MSVPTVADKPPPLPWQEDGEWQDVPELADLPPAEALMVYRTIRERLDRRVKTWLLLFGALVVLLAPLIGWLVVADCISWLQRERWGPVVRSGVALPLMMCAAVLLKPFLRRVSRRDLSRLARIELGTHCPECDYDLRGTADRAVPRAQRCPECGSAVPVATRGDGLPRGR